MNDHTISRRVLLASIPLAAAARGRSVQDGLAALDSLDALGPNHPRAYFFRYSEGQAANSRVSYEQWERSFERLMGIEGKVLDEEIPGRSARNIEFFTRFKQRHPNQLVLLHYNGNARDPRNAGPAFFAGHWNYFNGAKITADLPAEAGEIDVPVDNARHFRLNIGRYRSSNDPVGLCALNEKGLPDWSRAEQVELIAADVPGSKIRVRRGAFGAAPQAFTANRAYAAAHVTEGPWAGASGPLLWAYNYSSTCPRNAHGQTCADVLIDELAALFVPGGPLELFDGLQFDVLHHIAAAQNSANRGFDSNADTAADAGFFDGHNLYGEGVIEFLRRLKERLGPSKLLLADGWNRTDQRGFGLINGVESEGWPHLTDSRVDDWCGGINRMNLWSERSVQPAFSYVNHKVNVDGETVNADSPLISWATQRLVFAGAVITDCAICYSTRPPNDPGYIVGVFDELRMGEENKPGWLGRALGAAVHLAESRPNLVEATGLGQLLSSEGVIYPEDGATKLAAPAAQTLKFTVAPPAGVEGEWVLCLTMHAAPAPAALLLTANGSVNWIDRSGGFYRFHSRAAEAIEFAVEGPGPVWLRDAAIYAGAPTAYREFEHGLVIANPSSEPFSFDLESLFPGARFRRLKGSPLQDPVANDGSHCPGELSLPGKDALFLVRADQVN